MEINLKSADIFANFSVPPDKVLDSLRFYYQNYGQFSYTRVIASVRARNGNG